MDVSLLTLPSQDPALPPGRPIVLSALLALPFSQSTHHTTIHHLLLWRPPCCQGKEYICQHGLPARSVSGNLQRRRYIGREESIRSRHWIDPPRPIISWQPCANGGRPISPSICGGVGTRMRPSGGQQPSGPKLPRCGTKKPRSISIDW